MTIMEVNLNNFETEVLKSDKKVIVDFNANWCGPCRMLKPIMEEIAENNNQVKVVSINIDEEDELSEKYNVLSIPCIIIFDKGQEITRHVGMISKDDIEKLIGE